jgi:prepilin-type N-terminal cleavage/methylation domain-containing protein
VEVATNRLRRRRNAGFSLLELTLVVVIGGIVASFAVPEYSASSEAVRVDKSASDLRSIWRAQRRHNLERGVLAGSVSELTSRGYLPMSLGGTEKPFTFSVKLRGRGRFDIEARRVSGSMWSGGIRLDETGILSGGTRSSDGEVIRP